MLSGFGVSAERVSGRETAAGASLKTAGVFVLLLVPILRLYYHSKLFFYLDEYWTLWRLAEAKSFIAFLFEPHNEHFLPLFKGFYALEVALFRSHYEWYIFTNGALLAALGTLWESWLRRLGLRRPLSILAPLAVVTSLSQGDNVRSGFQACILLSAIFLLAALILHREGRRFSAIACAVISSLCFTSTSMVLLVLAGTNAYNYYRGKRRRELRYALTALAAFAVLMGADLWFSRNTAYPAVSGLGSKLGGGNLARLCWLTFSAAFYGPALHLFDSMPKEDPPDLGTAVFGLAAAALAIRYSSRLIEKRLLVELCAVQLALFAIVTPFRNTPWKAAFADRYYTLAFLPWVTALAIAFAPLLRKRRALAAAVAAALMMLAARNAARAHAARDEAFLIEAGRVSRLDYERSKALLRHSRGFGDIFFNSSVAPWLNTARFAKAVNLLEPRIPVPMTGAVAVMEVDDRDNRRIWGPIGSGREAVETLRFQYPVELAKIELLVTRSAQFRGSAALSITDASGEILWETRIPGDAWPSNLRIAVPVGGLHLKENEPYHLHLRNIGSLEGDWISAWMNDTGAHQLGETTTPEGIVGEWCGRMALIRDDSIPGVYRAGQWLFSFQGLEYAFSPFGASSRPERAEDQPVLGDWDGTGVLRPGVFRDGDWRIDLNGNHQWDGVEGGDAVYHFGLRGDTAVAGDWTGDGKTKLGVFRCPAPGAGLCTWLLDVGGKFEYDPATVVRYAYGLPGDSPVVSNWAGRGPDRPGVFRSGLWFVDPDAGGQTRSIYAFGLAGDVPVVGTWKDWPARNIGAFRKGIWFIDTNGDNTYSRADESRQWGLPGDKPVVLTPVRRR